MIQVMSDRTICFPSGATLRREAVSGTTFTQTMIFMRLPYCEFGERPGGSLETPRLDGEVSAFWERRSVAVTLEHEGPVGSAKTERVGQRVLDLERSGA